MKKGNIKDYLYFQDGLIRSLLIKPKDFVIASQIVSPDDFTEEDLKLTYIAIGDMVSQEREISPASLARYFDENKLNVSTDFIYSIVNEENLQKFFSGSIKQWAEKTKTESVRYKAEEIIRTGIKQVEASLNVPDELNTISNQLSELLTNSEIKKQRTLKEQIIEHREETERLKKGEGKTKKIPFPYPSLNYYTGGMGPGELIIVAARTGVGKTVAGVNIAKYAVDRHENYNTMFFALEMTERELLSRIIASECQIKVKSIGEGKMSDEEEYAYNKELDRLMDKNLIIDDNATVDIPYIRAKALKQKKEQGLDLIVIDYIQLIKTTSKRSEQEEIAYVSRELKLLAKDLNIPVVALTQVNRERTEENVFPKLQDIRGSGAIANDASIVIMIDRRLDDEGLLNPKATFYIAKNRQGEVGKYITVSSAMEYSLFIDSFDLNRSKPTEQVENEEQETQTFLNIEETTSFEDDFEEFEEDNFDIDEEWEED